MNCPEAINVVDVIKDETIIEIKGEIIHCEDDDYEGDYEYDEDEDEIEVEEIMKMMLKITLFAA